MEWEIVFAPVAKKRIAKIPQPERRRILVAIARLHEGLIGDIKPLKGRDEWRLRVGDWHVIMSVDMSERIQELRHKKTGTLKSRHEFMIEC